MRKYLIPLVLCMHSLYAYKDFVILSATYNNEKYAPDFLKELSYAQWSLLSALNQEYPEEHYRIIVINDNSTDLTQKILEDTIEQHPKKSLVTLINNKKHKGALRNHYHANHKLIRDDEIVINLDGDDALAHENVLSFYNDIYSEPTRPIWMTYGQYQELSTGNIGFCKPMPQRIVSANKFRSYTDTASHPRTYYSWLYKKIKKEDLQYKGAFFEMCADMATSIPMMEMARNHFLFIPEILYLYNDINPINDHKKDKSLQKAIDKYVRNLPRYQPLD